MRLAVASALMFFAVAPAQAQLFRGFGGGGNCAGGSCAAPSSMGMPASFGGGMSMASMPSFASAPAMYAPQPVYIAEPTYVSAPQPVARTQPPARSSIVPSVSASSGSRRGNDELAAINRVRQALGLNPIQPDARCIRNVYDNNRYQASRGMGHYIQDDFQLVAGTGDIDEAIGAWLMKRASREILLDPDLQFGACRVEGGYATFEAR